jgi:23S rRNA pseudouridine2605 synthase
VAGPMAERLQKVLAGAGLGSRRQIEEWIREGRIRVNGNVAKLGDRVAPTDRVQINGRLVQPFRVRPSKGRVIVYHKPEGEVTTRSDPEGRPTIFQNLPRLKASRWVAVGRLDINTSGLILLTTDGELANRLMHPSHGIEREYAVRVLGPVDPAMRERLTSGVELEDGTARFESLREAGGEGANRWYHVVIREGRNREVRRLWESQGVKVSRLTRVRYGPIALARSLRQGKWDELSDGEIQALLDLTGLPKDRLREDTAKRHTVRRHSGRRPPTRHRGK